MLEQQALFERQDASEHCEGATVTGEREVAEDVLETEPTVESPSSVVLTGDLGSGQQHVFFRASGQQSARQGATEAMPLSVRSDVQLGELEVVGQNCVDVLVAFSRTTQAVADLLIPPLVGRSTISVGNRHERALGCGQDCADTAPARPKDVLGPHRRAVVLGALRVAHRLDVDRQRFRQSSADFLG